MEASDGSGQALIVASESPEARRPAEGALYDPPSRQKNKAFPWPGKFHNFEADAVRRSIVGRRLACISLIDESHLHRSLLKCRECGQLYFSEFYEMVDWDDGDDAQYTAYVPVETPAEIDALKRAGVMEILFYTPRLQRDFPKGAKAARVCWISKDE